MRFFLILIAAVLLVGCARSNTMQISSNVIQITASAAPACGSIGAQKVAQRTAAVETISRGYDGFIISGAGYQNNVQVVGTTPVTASTTTRVNGTYSGNSRYGTYAGTGTSSTSVYGGQPIIAGSHDQSLVVQMFKQGEPGMETAVSAREVLGPNWADEVKKGPSRTCL